MMHPDPRPYRLTPQEKRVLALLLQGHHKKTAADVMGVSVNTISFHLKNVYGKLGVHSKTEAVVKGLMEGFLVADSAAM
jgi:DNA-binding CsgD family transcriptional regulator